MQKLNTIAVITPPNASVPGVLCVVEGLYPELGWSPEVRGFTLRHAEWIDDPGAACIPRLVAALAAVAPYFERSRDDANDPRLVVCTNFWSSAREALHRANLSPDAFVSITPGSRSEGGLGRMLLVDHLRDVMAKISLNMPEAPVAGHDRLILASELRVAFKELANKPRLLDDESQAPGLSRNDSLILCLGLAVHDLTKYGPSSCESPNRR